MAPKLLFIEGIPGSGKSTFARFIDTQLQRNGYCCKLYHESAFEHPIIMRDTADNAEHFITKYKENWTQFIYTLMKDDETIYIFEAALIQNTLLHLLSKEVPEKRIVELWEEIEHMLQPFDCWLVYFDQEDTLAAVAQMVEARGGEPYLQRKYEEFKHEPYFQARRELGPSSFYPYFEQFAALAGKSAIGFTKWRTWRFINKDKNWAPFEAQILDAWGVKHIPDPRVDKKILQQYIGSYRNESMGMTLKVELLGDALYIFGNKRLRPHSESRFYLDDMSAEITFDTAGDGIRMRITEKDYYANRSDDGTLFYK